MLSQAIPRLQARGCKVDLCCFGERSQLDEKTEASGCRIHRLQKSGNPWTVASQLESLLSKHSYDLLHSHFGYASGGIALAGARSSLPVINSLHSSAPTSLERWDDNLVLSALKKGWLRIHRSLLDRHVTLTLGHSQTNLDHYAPKGRSALLYNGVEFLAKKRQPNGTCQLLHVGSFRPAKNHRALLQIFKRIKLCEPSATLTCVGGGDLLPEIRRQAAMMGLENAVTFTGPQPDPWKYYGSADLMLFPSKSEGLANALIEAQAAQLPIAASDIPAHHESVGPSARHALFSLNNLDDAAQMALKQMRNPKGVEEARDYVHKSFSIDRFTEQLIATYRRELESDAPSRQSIHRTQ